MLYLFLALALTAIFVVVSRYGSGPERVVLQIWLVVSLLDLVYHVSVGPLQYHDIDLIHVVLDIMAMIGFLWVALRANRVWPLWIAALQLQPLVVHLAMFMQLPGNDMAYWLMMVAPADIEILILLIGTLAHVHRKRLIGPYRDWRLS